MNYMITDSRCYIRLNNGTPVTCKKESAQVFTEEKARNVLTTLPKTLKKFNFKLMPVAKAEDILEPDLTKMISGLDDYYYDYSDPKQDNMHKYSGRTFIEDLNDIPDRLKDMVAFISQLNTYVENMKYIEREYDLKIMDIRHYIRNNETKLGTVQMSKIGYFQQELERKRAECKINRNCCELFAGHVENFLDERFIEALDQMDHAEYRYRRLSKNSLNEIVGRK